MREQKRGKVALRSVDILVTFLTDSKLSALTREEYNYFEWKFSKQKQKKPNK